MAKARRQDGVTTQDVPLPKVYGLLEPGPVVFLTTADRSRANVMTLSWHMMVEFTPPLVACVGSSRELHPGRFAQDEAVRDRDPNQGIGAAEFVGVGNSSGRGVAKFAAFGMTPLPAARVTPPLIAECYANFECKVVDTRLVNKFDLFVIEVVKRGPIPLAKTRERCIIAASANRRRRRNPQNGIEEAMNHAASRRRPRRGLPPRSFGAAGRVLISNI